MHGVTLFTDTTMIMLAKLVLAMFLGTLIGTERAVLAKQAAGMRTFGLVSLGAALFIIIANYVDTAYIGVLNFDPMHMASGIVTGIGFIGGGLIIFRGDTLHGVTTAAGLWMAAAIGMAVGFGMYNIAVFSAFLTLMMFTVMWYVENRFKHWFVEFAAEHDIHVQSSSRIRRTRSSETPE
jgi:putative Mg2+ transporter-C (MgtC) family protein